MTEPRNDSHFDADAIAAVQEEPTLVVGGLLYRGRLLSIEEWLPFWERQQRLDAEDSVVLEQRTPERATRHLRARNALYRDYFRAVFPARRYRWWAPDPVAHLMAQPFSVVEATVAFFFILQVRATFGEEAFEKLRATVGTPSPNKTVAAPTGAAP